MVTWWAVRSLEVVHCPCVYCPDWIILASWSLFWRYIDTCKFCCVWDLSSMNGHGFWLYFHGLMFCCVCECPHWLGWWQQVKLLWMFWYILALLFLIIVHILISLCIFSLNLWSSGLVWVDVIINLYIWRRCLSVCAMSVCAYPSVCQYVLIAFLYRKWLQNLYICQIYNDCHLIHAWYTKNILYMSKH